MRFFKRKDAAAPDGPIPDEWELSAGELDGKPIVTRFRIGARPWVGSADYPIQIGVAIPFLQPNDQGMPVGDEVAQLEAFEDALIERAGTQAVFVGVLTTGGMREFVLYTGSGDWIPAFHQDLIAAMPTHEVQVMAQTDPKWATFRQFVQT